MKKYYISAFSIIMIIITIIIYVYYCNSSKLVYLEDDKVTKDIKITYSNGENENAVTQDIILPLVDDKNNSIVWYSSNNAYVNNLGKVNRPIGDDVTVYMHCITKIKNKNYIKKFKINILKEEGINELKEIDDNAWALRADKNKLVIDGCFSNHNIKNEVDALYSLNSVKKILGIKSPENEFALIRQDSDGGLEYFRFQQVYEGVEVWPNQAMVCADKDGNASGINIHYLPLNDFNTIPDMSLQQLLDNIKLTNKSDINSMKLIIYALYEEPKLVWQLEHDNRIEFYDANNGTLLHEIPTITYY